MRHLFGVENIDRWGSNWSPGAKMCFFDPKFGYLGQKVNFLYGNHDFCPQGISPVYHWLQYSHWDHPQKDFCFWGMGNFPRLTPVFGHFRQCLIAGTSTLNFGLWSTKLGGPVRTIKKMTNNVNGPGHGWNYGETAIFMVCPKVFFFLPKMRFFPKTPKIC